ncbi:DUF3073 domain-containing protein [Rhodococcus sp. NPDC058521]|uniref:DUF3073 domain-containing protein n=1 Tax=Rhodococcus sp. NPDC058521 TaxID=3346536 RepID=UPI00364BD0F1
MGRGRAKAKQTKVARELKYSVPTTDFDSLQRELAGGSSSSHRSGPLADPLSDRDGYAREDDDDDWR